MKKQILIVSILSIVSLILLNSVEISQKYSALNQFNNSELDFQAFQKTGYVNYLVPAMWIIYVIYLANKVKNSLNSKTK